MQLKASLLLSVAAFTLPACGPPMSSDPLWGELELPLSLSTPDAEYRFLGTLSVSSVTKTHRASILADGASPPVHTLQLPADAYAVQVDAGYSCTYSGPKAGFRGCTFVEASPNPFLIEPGATAVVTLQLAFHFDRASEEWVALRSGAGEIVLSPRVESSERCGAGVGCDSMSVCASLDSAAPRCHALCTESRDCPAGHCISVGDGSQSFRVCTKGTAEFVGATFPTNEASEVSPLATIRAEFSRGLDVTSVHTDSFRLYCDQQPVLSTVVYARGSVVLTPRAELALGTRCEATLTTEIRDAYGAALPRAYIWSFTTATERQNIPPSSLEFTLLGAAARGNMELLGRLLDLGVRVDAEPIRGSTALIVALSEGQEAAALLLLERGANPHFRTHLGDTPLHLAAHRGLGGALAALLERGADPNVANHRGALPLKLASIAERDEAEDLLVAAGAALAGHLELRVGTTLARLSREAQTSLMIFEQSEYPEDRSVLLVQEPHFNVEAQWALLEGLSHFFEDNPSLRAETAFLSEAAPAEESLSIAPLRAIQSRPSRRLLNTVLESLLIPASFAYAWSQPLEIPIVGTEDAALYSASALAWSEERYPTWELTLLARNQSLANVLIGQVASFENPMLFVGGRHLGSLPSSVVASAQAQLPPEATDPVTTLLRSVSNRGISDYLRDARIGYTLLGATALEAPELSATNESRYRHLFTAQFSGDYSGYTSAFRAERGVATDGVTTRPAVTAAASLASAEQGDDDADEGGSGGNDPDAEPGFDLRGQLARIWADARLFMKWLRGSASLSRTDNPLNHTEARQVLDNARRHFGEGQIDTNPDGLAGREQNDWGPHFKVRNIHIPVQPGFTP